MRPARLKSGPFFRAAPRRGLSLDASRTEVEAGEASYRKGDARKGDSSTHVEGMGNAAEQGKHLRYLICVGIWNQIPKTTWAYYYRD